MSSVVAFNPATGQPSFSRSRPGHRERLITKNRGYPSWPRLKPGDLNYFMKEQFPYKNEHFLYSDKQKLNYDHSQEGEGFKEVAKDVVDKVSSALGKVGQAVKDQHILSRGLGIAASLASASSDPRVLALAPKIGAASAVASQLGLGPGASRLERILAQPGGQLGGARDNARQSYFPLDANSFHQVKFSDVGIEPKNKPQSAQSFS